MKKYLALLILLGCAVSAFAQNPTAVTGTITDPNGIVYYPATVLATLLPTMRAGRFPTANGQPINPNPGAVYTVGPVNTAPDGSFAMSLFPNSAITPAASQYIITVTASGTAPPAGLGQKTFSVTVTISGTSQSLTSTLSAAALALLPTPTSSACATCVTAAGTLTSNALMIGAGLKAASVLASLGTITTVLHGNAAGAPTFGAVSLTADVSGSLPHANIAATAVTPGPYTNANITVAADGSITAAANGSAGSSPITTFTPYTALAISGSTGITLTVNRVHIIYFEIPVAVSAGHIQSYWPVGDVSGAHNYAVAVYSGCGTVGGTATLVANTAVIHPASATVLSTAFAQGTVAFTPGSYCLAVTGDNATANFLVNGNVSYNPLAATDTGNWNHPTAVSAAGVFPGTFTVPATATNLTSNAPYITQLQP